MAVRQQESTGSGSTDMKLTKFRAMLQDVDRYLSGRSGGVFMFSGTGAKYKAYYSNQLKRYNSDVFVSVMEINFNPTSPARSKSSKSKASSISTAT